MEAKLKQQTSQMGDHCPSTSASANASCHASSHPCASSKGEEIWKGMRDDRILENWVADTERAMRGQSDSEAVDSLIFHLEGVTKEEIKTCPASQWTTPTGVFSILREVFSEQLTPTQAMRKLYAR